MVWIALILKIFRCRLICFFYKKLFGFLEVEIFQEKDVPNLIHLSFSIFFTNFRNESFHSFACHF